jgi:hypothetical protein
LAQQNEPGRETASEEALELKASHLGISLDALLAFGSTSD